jgi:hypothetical protein
MENGWNDSHEKSTERHKRPEMAVYAL